MGWKGEGTGRGSREGLNSAASKPCTGLLSPRAASMHVQNSQTAVVVGSTDGERWGKWFGQRWERERRVPCTHEAVCVAEPCLASGTDPACRLGRASCSVPRKASLPPSLPPPRRPLTCCRLPRRWQDLVAALPSSDRHCGSFKLHQCCRMHGGATSFEPTTAPQACSVIVPRTYAPAQWPVACSQPAQRNTCFHPAGLLGNGCAALTVTTISYNCWRRQA